MAMRLSAVAVAAFRLLGRVVHGLSLVLSLVLLFVLVPEWRRRLTEVFWIAASAVFLFVVLPAAYVIGWFKGLAAASEVQVDLKQAAREGRAVLASGGASILFEFEPGPVEPQRNRTRAQLRTALATGGAGLLFEWEAKRPSAEETGS